MAMEKSLSEVYLDVVFCKYCTKSIEFIRKCIYLGECRIGGELVMEFGGNDQILPSDLSEP